MQKRKEKKKREKKETGNGDAHTLRKGIPGPKPHFLPSKVTETSLLYLRSGSCAMQNQELSQSVGSGLASLWWHLLEDEAGDTLWNAKPQAVPQSQETRISR